MILYRKFFMSLLVACLLLHWSGVVHAQSSTSPQNLEGLLRPDSVAARKATLQARLQELEKSNLPKDELEKTQAALGKLLKALTALDEAWQRRVTYTTYLEELPQRLQELTAERRQLESRPPSRFPTVTEALRDEYEAQRQAVQKQLEDLTSQTAAGDVRLARIAGELPQRATARTELEKKLLEARSKAAQAEKQPPPVSEVELLEVQLQGQRAEMEALEAEREWLTKRGPLHDALRRVAQLRLTHVQQDLNTIKQALGEVRQQEQETLSETAARLEQVLARTTDPLEKLRLTVRLETVNIRQITADYRDQLTRLDDEIQEQEKQNVRVKQDAERLASLVEKYASGEGVAQRLLVGFERLRRERQRFSDDPMLAFKTRLRLLTEGTSDDPAQALKAHLRVLNEAMFALDDRLYEFDRQAESRLAGVETALATAAAPQREAEVAKLRKTLEAQKAALREQQQVLTTLTQESTRLTALYREHRRLLDDSYRLVLSKMFWLRDGDTMSWQLLRDMLIGVTTMATHLHAFARTELGHLRERFASMAALWFLVVLLVLALPWVAYRVRARLQHLVRDSLATSAGRNQPPGILVVILAALQSAVWPAYIVLLAWSRLLFVVQRGDQADLALALISGLNAGALVLWIGLFGRTILQPDGWGQQFWGLNPDLRHFLRRVLTVGCVAALILLVPRRILLTMSEVLGASDGEQTLARLLFLAFQGVILVLLVIVGRRSGPLMAAVLARSRERQGLLWNVWPFIHLALLGGVAGVMVFDVLGYRYAAKYVWVNALESLSVALGLRLLLLVLMLRLLQKTVRAVFSVDGRLQQRNAGREAAEHRLGTVLRAICEVVVAMMAVGIVLEIWGISAVWLLTSPLALQLLTRTVVIVLTAGLAFVIIQVSNVLAEYLLRPKTTSWGETREAGRKLRTMTPLVQTILKAGVAFVAVLIVLEQVGVATGPILAGVGIFGLAIGFASQSLIKDIINGLFILFEDSVSVGDIANLRGIGGQIEKITLRAITLRSLDGTVHVIPNSEIGVVSNLTKVFSRYVLDIRVGLNEDVNLVMTIMREIDEEMRRTPEFGKDMLIPLEMWGVDRFEDSGLIIRARLQTRPMQQWRIGREFNRHLQEAFKAHGIQMPVPHRRLAWDMPPNGQAISHASLEDSPSLSQEREP